MQPDKNERVRSEIHASFAMGLTPKQIRSDECSHVMARSCISFSFRIPIQTTSIPYIHLSLLL
jgi:hypothetical protein